MSLYKAFETDPSIETDGLLLQYGENSKGQPITFKIRRAGGANHRFAKVFEARTKHVRNVINIPGALDPKVNERIMREVYADAVIIDMQGAEDREGNPLEYTRDNVIMLLTDLPELFKDIVQQSTNAALFRKNIAEAEAKN